MRLFLFLMMMVVLLVNIAVARIGDSPKNVATLEPNSQNNHRFQKLAVQEDEEEEEEAGGDEVEIEDESVAAPCVEDAEHVGSGTGYVVKCGDPVVAVSADASAGGDEEEEEEEAGAPEEEEA